MPCLSYALLLLLLCLVFLMPCLSYALLLLLYATTKMQVMCCGAVCFAISNSQHLLARGVRALHALSPLTLSHLNYFLYDKAYRGELCSPLAGEASSPLSLPLVRVSLRLTHPARLSYTQPGTIYLRYWCWQLGRASPLQRGEIAHTSIILAYTVRCIAVFAYHCIAL